MPDPLSLMLRAVQQGKPSFLVLCMLSASSQAGIEPCLLAATLAATSLSSIACSLESAHSLAGLIAGRTMESQRCMLVSWAE